MEFIAAGPAVKMPIIGGYHRESVSNLLFVELLDLAGAGHDWPSVEIGDQIGQCWILLGILSMSCLLSSDVVGRDL